MIQNFRIGAKSGITENKSEESNWIALENATEEERTQLIQKYKLPEEIFIGANRAEEVSHLMPLENTALKNAYVLVLTNLSAAKEETIEARLEPIIFIVSDSLLITYMAKDSFFIERLLKRYQNKIETFEGLLTYSIFMIYNHFIQELIEIEKEIDELEIAARKTTENKALFKLADTERKMIYIDHTLAGQKSTLATLWEKEEFVKTIDDQKVLYDIQLHQKHAEELVRIYRDLLETVGGLFTDMMDNNLNHLMKYLDSAALIISIPALISGIWGMNTGGLPGKESHFGFFMVVAVAVLLAIIVGIHIKRKDFSK